MKKLIFDNTVDLSKVILWQYDNAPKFNALIVNLQSIVTAITVDFWRAYYQYVMNIDNAGSDSDPFNGLGLNVWGGIVGLQRPNVTISSTSRPVSDDLYRRMIKAKFYLLRQNGSCKAINKYLNIMFNGNVIVQDGQNMSIAYATIGTLSTEESALISQHSELVFVYPAGVRSNTPITPAGFIGLNDTTSSGQNKESFAVSESSTVGGTFYGN